MKDKLSFIARIIKNKGYLPKIPALLRMLKSHLRGEFKISYKELAIAIGVIVYVISPLDLIPGVFIDDLGLVILAMGYLIKEINRYEIWENSVKRGNTNVKIVDAEIVK